MTAQNIIFNPASFDLADVRDDAIAVVFQSTEFVVEGQIDPTSAPAIIQRHADGCSIYQALLYLAPSPNLPADLRGAGATIFRVDHNTGPLVVPVSELPVVLAWFDATFPDWRTKRGAYSTHVFHAVDYTRDEMTAAIAREEFWSGLDTYLDRCERAA